MESDMKVWIYSLHNTWIKCLKNMDLTESLLFSITVFDEEKNDKKKLLLLWSSQSSGFAEDWFWMQWFSKRDLQTNILRITWNLEVTQFLGFHARHDEFWRWLSLLCFKKPSCWFWCMPKFEKQPLISYSAESTN